MQLLLMGLSIVAGLFLISLIRIYRLSRSNNRLRLENAKMSKQTVLHALKGLDDAHKKALSEALAKISQLESALAAKPAAPVASALPKPPPPPVPALPTMDALRIQPLESELAAAKAEIATSKQQTATLQRALLLARHRLPVTAMRKSAPRTTARNA